VDRASRSGSEPHQRLEQPEPATGRRPQQQIIGKTALTPSPQVHGQKQQRKDLGDLLNERIDGVRRGPHHVVQGVPCDRRDQMRVAVLDRDGQNTTAVDTGADCQQ